MGYQIPCYFSSFFFLIIYWLIFWRKFLLNPYLLCTSEVASTFFPHWQWMGRELRRGIIPSQDNLYYKLPGSIPFLSSFYPPSLIASFLASFLSIDRAFRCYTYLILLHFLIGSFFAYYLFGNLFAAITLTYAGYMIKPNTPCFVFSACWVPLALKGGILGAIAWSMALFGGYYPILVYIMPVVAFLQPLSFIGGLLLASSQLLPFLGYFKRSVRMEEKVDKNFGRLPWYRLLDLINPVRFIGTVNGVHYTETAMYMGLAPFLIWRIDIWMALLCISVLIVLGYIVQLQRIPARCLYLATISITFLSSKVETVNNLVFPLLILQGYLLLKNSSIYPSFPFSQWWDRPSKLYTKKPKTENWPYFTGYLKGVHESDYRGAFRLVS